MAARWVLAVFSVTLLGAGAPAEAHARVAGTINYELVAGICRAPERTLRVVTDG